MHILFVSSSSGSRGGGEGYLVYLGEALSQRGHQVTLWTSNHERMDEVANRFGAFGGVIRAEYKNTYDHGGRCFATVANGSVTRAAVKSWETVNPDILHFNKQNLEDGLDLLRGSKQSKVPSVCTIHITQTARRQGASLALARDVLAGHALRKYQGTFVTVLEERKHDLEHFLGQRSKVTAIPNGVPTPDYCDRDRVRRNKRSELGVAPDALLVMAAGRMVAQKRPLLFLELVEKIRRANPETKFVWVGDGELSAEWLKDVERRGMKDNVIYAGWQPEVAPYYLAADVLLHTAEYEGLPLALLEAMSFGLPCAITENLLKEMPFLGADNSISVDGSNQWQTNLLDRPGLIRRGQAARKLVEEKFSYSSMAAAYERLYLKSVAR